LLGSFAIANQWSVENLTEQLRHKFLLVEHLKNQVYTTEKTIKRGMNQNFEQIRASDQKKIKQLQDNLELLHQNSQTNQVLVTQRDKLIKQLQPRLTQTENTTIDILAFKSQASKINERMEVSQQELYLKVDVIHK
jgi:ABC-type phosphate transport system auxiliary subunit